MDFPGYEQNADEINLEDDSYDDEEEDCSSDKLMCDTCEKEFQIYWQYQKHMSEHRTCGLDGCTFTAHEKIIEKHVKMQHSSGLYDKIKNVVTPEDISRWVAERKRKYPSKENVERRYQQQEEMLKRGEKLTRNAERFDKKNKTRFGLHQKHKWHQNQSRDKKKKFRKPSYSHTAHTASVIDEKADWNGTLFPFRGTRQLYDEVTTEEVINNFDDSEWMEDNAVESTSTSGKIVLNNALGSLISAYNSSDDSDIEPKSDVTLVQTVDKTIENQSDNLLKGSEKVAENVHLVDDEGPVEEKIQRVEATSLVSTSATVATKGKDEVKGKGKRKRIRRRKFENTYKQHESAASSISSKNSTKRPNSRKEFSGAVYKKRRVTLLERLLASEIMHERNVLLQCVRYVVANRFFDEKNCDNVDTGVANIPTTSENQGDDA